MDRSKIALEILKANSQRKINWVFFIVGLVMFILSYMYLKKATYKLNSTPSANPFGISYADALNSKQLDTIRDVPNFRRLPPYTPSTSPVNARTFLGVNATLTSNFSYTSSTPISLFSTAQTNLWYPSNAYTSTVSRIQYTCTPSNIYSNYGLHPQLYFQNESTLLTDPVVVFVPHSLNVGNDTGVLLYTDYDIVFDGIPGKPNYLLFESGTVPPLIESTTVGIAHATRWYSDPLSTTFFEPSLVSNLPNPDAGTELMFGNGDQSQIPFLALNQVYVVTNGDFTSTSSFQAIPSPTSLITIPQGITIPSTLGSAYNRKYYFRDAINLSDGICISIIGAKVASETVQPTTTRNTWIVLNGKWSTLPEFVFFDSSKNENPLIILVLGNAENIPISLASLNYRWIVMSTNLTTFPTILEPRNDFLNTSLGIPLNAFGRQGFTIMSSSNLNTSVMPYRTILSVRGVGGAGNYYWFVMYSSWIAGFVGEAYIADDLYSTPQFHSWNFDFTQFANLQLAIDMINDLSRTFVFIMFFNQTQLIIPSNESDYSFILVVVGAVDFFTIDIYYDSDFITTLNSPPGYEDTVDPNYTQMYSRTSVTTPYYWPMASISYFITVANSTVTISRPFGFSKSILESL
jgi:hypothetical protein